MAEIAGAQQEELPREGGRRKQREAAAEEANVLSLVSRLEVRAATWVLCVIDLPLGLNAQPF